MVDARLVNIVENMISLVFLAASSGATHISYIKAGKMLFRR